MFHGDCMDAMVKMEDNEFDLAIVDPPYGIQKNMRGSRRMGKQMQQKEWNYDTPTKEYFDNAKKRYNQHKKQLRLF